MRHLIIVGAGIVGLSCAWSAQRRSWHVTVIDRDFEGDRASHGNAGGIAVTECAPFNPAGKSQQVMRWLLDPLGPLTIRPRHAPRMLSWFLALRKVAEPDNYVRIAMALAALNDRCLSDLEAVLVDLGIGADLHKRGALAVYETQAAFDGDAAEWEMKRSLGVRFRSVGVQELRELEPNLASGFAQGIMLEDWAHVDDPRRIVTALRDRVRALGANFITGDAVKISSESPERPAVLLADGRRCAGDRVLIAAGAWSARLAQSVSDRILLESERGYNTTLPASSTRLNREVIFVERKFVATPLAVGLRIGGAAEFAGLDDRANYRRSDALLRLARRYILNLDERDAQRWMGQRPATPDSLPVIGPSPSSERVLYAFGHGHLGLTQAATTGELIADLLCGTAPSIDMRPYSAARF
jgi:D-amino-acid dehydrogenase